MTDCKRRIETRSHPSQHVNVSPYIPDEVLENIFSFLPIKDAIKVGVLSTRFKKSWVLSRKLKFDEVFKKGRCSRRDFILIVNKVLNLHSAPNIESFSLCFDISPDNNDDKAWVETWVQKAAKKGVKELELDFYQESTRIVKPYFPANIFDIYSLRVLKLTFCNLINLPTSGFKGLSLLNTLVLRHVNITTEFTDTLFSNCLLLETLDFAHCSGEFKIRARNLKRFTVLKIGGCSIGYSRIEIDAPTLTSFLYSGIFHIFKFGDNISLLKDVLFNFKPTICLNIPFHRVHKLVNIVSKNIRAFSTTSIFLESLSPGIQGSEFREMSYSFQNLKELQLMMVDASYCNPLDILLFVKNCPSLEKLLIDLDAISFKCGSYWEVHHRQYFEKYKQGFPSIKFIKLSGFKFQEYEVKLATVFLEKAINLEKLILETAKPVIRNNVTTTEYSKAYFECYKASNRAQIHIYEHFNDASDLFPLNCKNWFSNF